MRKKIYLVVGCSINAPSWIICVTSDKQKALRAFRTYVLKRNSIKDSMRFMDKDSVERKMRWESKNLTPQQFYDRWHTAVGWCDIPSLESYFVEV